MILIPDDMLSEASQYSDWRLYPENVERCSALPEVLMESGSISKSQSQSIRAWERFPSFSENLKKFSVKFLDECCATGVEKFATEFISESGKHLRFRVQSLGGYFACRFIHSMPINLDELAGLTQSLKDLVLSSNLSDKGGLILFVGNVGTGKSVCAAASMRERLKIFGGHLVVVGDPPEQPVGDDGLSFVGESGFVDTVDICKIGYTTGLSMILRSYPAGVRPSLLFNEIRSDSNAFDLIHSALNGQVTFATMHASSADAAIDRLIAWCVRGGTDITLVRNMLSQSLFGITHHRIEYGKVKITPYICSDETRQKIREGHPLPIKATTPIKFN